MENHLAIAKAKYQAIAPLNFTERMNLRQMVEDSTRVDNIIDLLLTDCICIHWLVQFVARYKQRMKRLKVTLDWSNIL